MLVAAHTTYSDDLNIELPSDVILVIEKRLEIDRRVLDPHLKARAVGLLYLHYRESGKSAKEDEGTVES